MQRRILKIDGEGTDVQVLLQQSLLLEEERIGVQAVVGEGAIDLAVEDVGSGQCVDVDLRSGRRTLLRVVHRGVDPKLLDELGRGRGKRVAVRAEDRSSHARRAADAGALADVERVTLRVGTRAGLAVEQIGGVDAVHLERVGGIALAVGPDRLVADSSIGIEIGQQLGVHPGSELRRVGEAAGRAERQRGNLVAVQRIAVGVVGGVQQRAADDFNRLAHLADLQGHGDGGGGGFAHRDTRDRGGVEAVVRGDHFISADGEVEDLEEAVGLGLRGAGHVDVRVGDRDGCTRDGGSARVKHGSVDGTEGLLGVRDHRRNETKRCKQRLKYPIPHG